MSNEEQLSLSFADVVRQSSSSSDVTSPRLIISPTYCRSNEHSPTLSLARDRVLSHCKPATSSSSSSTSRREAESPGHHEANSTPTTTPKRRRLSRRLKTSSSSSTSSATSSTVNASCSSFSMLSSRDSNHDETPQHCLITGYVRHRIAMSHFPVDIASLIESFYDEVTYWSIRGENMNTFKSMRNGRAMFGPTFEICKGVAFDLTLCPNGWKCTQEGSVQFYIELKCLPANVANITVYYELYCKQTGSQCKKIRVFRKATDAQSWGTNNMLIDECSSFDRLDFAALVKVLHVGYKNNDSGGPRDLYIAPRTMLEHTRFCYHMDKALLAEFVNCHEGKFYYSRSFGQKAFCLEIAPNGWHSSNRGKVMLYLRLLQLPQRVKSIGCECRFDSDQRGLVPSWTEQQLFSYDMHGMQWPVDVDLVALKSLAQGCTLKLIVKIKVTEVIDVGGNRIQRDQWSEYGIACSSTSRK